MSELYILLTLYFLLLPPVNDDEVVCKLILVFKYVIVWNQIHIDYEIIKIHCTDREGVGKI